VTNQDAGSVVSGSIRPTEPGPEVRRLEVFIGRWITEGQLVEGAGEPAGRIIAGDVYEWPRRSALTEGPRPPTTSAATRTEAGYRRWTSCSLRSASTNDRPLAKVPRPGAVSPVMAGFASA
jgi:hypothetical protein